MNPAPFICFAVLLLQPPSTKNPLRERPGREQQTAAPDAVYHRITQGSLQFNFMERGEIQPVTQTDVVCRVRSEDATGKATTITWLIDDGTVVKKGELVARLDDTKHKDACQRQKLLCETRKAELAKVSDQREIDLSRSDFEIEKAELGLRLVDLELKDAADESAKSRLALKKRLAELTFNQAKREAAFHRRQADAMLVPAQLAVRASEERLSELEAQLQCCHLLAPHDGMATYPVSESSRFGSAASIGVGEPVKEGQKVIVISDLSKMQAVCKVHESIVTKIKPGQKAEITVAGTPVSATVSHVSPVASTTDWMSADVKVYPVRLKFENTTDLDSIRPGMSGNITIKIAEVENATLIPIQAVREQRGQRYCYVKTGNGMERRTIKTGISNTQMMEVTSGVNPGDEVVMNPPRNLDTREPAKPVIPGPKPLGAIHLKSVRPEGVAGTRSFIERYGLTPDDLAFIHSLSPLAVAPIRLSTAGIRNDAGTINGNYSVIAATSELSDFYPTLSAYIEGRFLVDSDNTENKRVVVIGRALADKLYPLGNALGSTLIHSGRNTTWTIVGILSEQSGDLSHFNDIALFPWAVMRAHTGEITFSRTAGMRRAEAVPYTHLLIQPAPDQDMKQTARIIRARLEATHTLPDWTVIEPSAR
ncbi:MAG: efflux RND transporter periplasmic adaptor subunit [Gemmatales bacterium]